MPHYKDGTLAKVGDFVKGKPYNTDREIVGTLVQITEGTESCNCIVAFVTSEPINAPIEAVYELQRQQVIGPILIRRMGGRIPADGGGDQTQEALILKARSDYGEVRAFTKIA